MRRRLLTLIGALIIFSASFVNLIQAQEAPGAPAPATCGGEPQQGCPCGKMPVCVISDHEDGFFSQTILDQAEHSSWEGFGQDGMSDYGAAMVLEMAMAAALAQTVPCVEPIVLNSYNAATQVISLQAEESGLTQRIQDAIAAGDEERLKELQAELDKLFEKFGVGDLPWRDPELAKEHLMHRLSGCIAVVQLSGKSGAGGFTVAADTSVPMVDINGQSSSTSSSPDGGMGELAKKIAGPLMQAQEKLFCTCQTVLERCNVTNFELSNQESECVRTITCCGQTTTEGPEKVKGLAFGETRKHEPKCCSPLARLRAGEKIDGMELDEEDREVTDQIWCPGTWNLRALDFDCDGMPNAKDETPRPPKEVR